MLINQLAVFVENKPGRMHRFCKILSDGNINIETMSVAETADFGIVRAVTDDNVKAAELLKSHGYTLRSMDVLGVETENTPGGLTEILEIFDREDISVEYLYSYTRNNSALILFKVNDNLKAEKLLAENGIKV